MEIIKNRKTIKAGVYLVIDPAMDEAVLLKKLEDALQEEIAALQIWDHFLPHQNKAKLMEQISALGHKKNVPVLINNRWEYLKSTALDGVHFDQIPEHYNKIKQSVNRPFITGLTCNNDLSAVRWATENNIDYISFCSIFPSATDTSCELVNFDTIRETRRITSMPVFLAGGIKPENINKLNELDFEGVAVISGVMGADSPSQAIKTYSKQLKTKTT